MSNFVGIGVEEHTGRHLLSFRTTLHGVEDAQTGVYLDTLIMLMTIRGPRHHYLYWMAPDSTGHIKGHCASFEAAGPDEDFLADFRAQLRGIFPTRKLYVADSLDEARRTFCANNMSAEMADNVVKYIRSCC